MDLRGGLHPVERRKSLPTPEIECRLDRRPVMSLATILSELSQLLLYSSVTYSTVECLLIYCNFIKEQELYFSAFRSLPTLNYNSIPCIKLCT
jgi:hypothetical protein